MNLANRQFSSLGEFRVFVLGLDLRKMAADIQGRSVVAKELAHHVKDRIGRPDMLPPPLADSTVADRVAQGFSANETLKRTGELQRSIGWEHTSPLVTVIGSRDPKAIYHELGTPRIPRRSFLAATASERNTEMFEKYLAAFTAMFVAGNVTTHVMSEAESL